MRKESKEIEFKEKISKSYLKTVSAYSNYKDGKIIFGINDNGDIIGLEKVTENKLNIENTINDSIKPKPEYTLDIEKIEVVPTKKHNTKINNSNFSEKETRKLNFFSKASAYSKAWNSPFLALYEAFLASIIARG